MKKILLVTMLIFVLAFTFVACDPTSQEPPVSEHEHTYSNAWTYDGSNHWHAATCEHTSEKSGSAPHSFSDVIVNNTVTCAVCGYSEYSVPVKPEPPHEHTYKTEYTADEYSHWLETTCGHNVENGAPHDFTDGVCATCGWWSSATEVLVVNLSKSDVWDYTFLLDSVTINNVNLLSDGIEHDVLTVSGELKLSMSADGQIEGVGYFETPSVTMKAVVQDGTVYAVGNGKYIRCSFSELLEQNGVDLEQVQGYVDELNANTQTVRKYVEQAQQYLSLISADDDTVKQLLSSLVKIDEVNSTDKLSAYVLDVAILRQLNETLATTTVEQYANAMLAGLSDTALGLLLGDNLATLPDNVYALLNTPIGATLLKLRLENYTLDDLLGEVNALIAKYYPDDKVNTIDELLPVFGVDLKGVTVKEAIIAASLLSPETLWNSRQQDESKQISADEISASLESMIQAYGDKTIYEAMLADFEQLSNDDVKQLVDEYIDMLSDRVTVTFFVDDNGVLQQVELLVKGGDVDDGQTDGQSSPFEGLSGTIVLKRDHLSEQDYSRVIEQVNEYYNSQN